jgi:hypothetical protein
VEEKRGFMYESRQHYERIVESEVRLLDSVVRHKISHGDAGVCPRCRTRGVYDIEGLGFSTDENAIYFSTVFSEWRCRVCDYRIH